MIIKPFTQICLAVYPNAVKCGKVIFLKNKLNFNRATTKILFLFKKKDILVITYIHISCIWFYFHFSFVTIWDYKGNKCISTFNFVIILKSK